MKRDEMKIERVYREVESEADIEAQRRALRLLLSVDLGGDRGDATERGIHREAPRSTET